MTQHSALALAVTPTPSALALAVKPIVENVRIPSDDRFTVGGHSQKSDPRMNRFMRTESSLPLIVAQVAQLLYDRFYMQPDSGRGSYMVLYDRLLRQSFADSLGAANTTEWSWQSGWKLIETRGERLLLRNARGQERLATQEEFEPSEDNEGGRLRLARGSSTQQTGWYHVRGARDHNMSDSSTVRIYFNTCQAGAVPLTSSVTRFMNRAGIPFHFKIMDEPQGFMRTDSAVLYAPANEWQAIARALSDIYREAGRWLKEATPLYTKKLAPGMGLGEDPGNGESFGMHRSRLVAEALWRAGREGVSEEDAIIRFVEERFEEEGLRKEAPHLGPGSTRTYDIALEPWRRRVLEALEGSL